MCPHTFATLQYSCRYLHVRDLQLLAPRYRLLLQSISLHVLLRILDQEAATNVSKTPREADFRKLTCTTKW